MRRTPSRMSSSRDAGEVQAHRRAAAAVEVGGAARARTRRCAPRARGRAGRSCRCSRAASPTRTGRPAGAVHVASGGKCSASASSIVSRRRAVELAQLVEVVLPAALGEVGGDEQLATATTSRGRRPACPCSSSRAPARAPPPSRARMPGERIFENVPEVDDELAAVERVAASAAARPRSAAGRTGCPRAPAARARGRPRRGAGGAGATCVTPPGFWKVGTV